MHPVFWLHLSGQDALNQTPMVKGQVCHSALSVTIQALYYKPTWQHTASNAYGMHFQMHPHSICSPSLHSYSQWPTRCMHLTMHYCTACHI